MSSYETLVATRQARQIARETYAFHGVEGLVYTETTQELENRLAGFRAHRGHPDTRAAQIAASNGRYIASELQRRENGGLAMVVDYDETDGSWMVYDESCGRIWAFFDADADGDEPGYQKDGSAWVSDLIIDNRS